ncbi:hypothetical protein RI367_004651 [Sorochytrium milnesiophthora]
MCRATSLKRRDCLVVHASLWSEDMNENRTMSVDSSLEYSAAARQYLASTTQSHLLRQSESNLFGCITENGQWLYDLNGAKHFFFVFKDLRIRIEGRHRVLFQLFDLSRFSSESLDVADSESGLDASPPLSAPLSTVSVSPLLEDEVEGTQQQQQQQQQAAEAAVISVRVCFRDAKHDDRRLPPRRRSVDEIPAATAVPGAAFDRQNPAISVTELMHAIHSVSSAIILACTAKQYPGLKESTPLSRCFAEQGVKMMIRDDRRTKHQ